MTRREHSPHHSAHRWAKACLAVLLLALCGLPVHAQDDDADAEPAAVHDGGLLRLDPGAGPEKLEQVLNGVRGVRNLQLQWLRSTQHTAGKPLPGIATPGVGLAVPYLRNDVPVSDPTYDGYPGSFHAEPSIAANGSHVVIAFNDGGADAASPNPDSANVNADGFAVSSDGGASYSDQGKRPGLGTASAVGDIDAYNGDNVIAAGTDANELYYLSDGGAVTCYTAPCPPNPAYRNYFNAPVVSRSLDGGQTWSAPVDASNGAGTDGTIGLFDKGWIAVDHSVSSAHYGNIYVSWSDFGAGTSGTDTDVWVAWSDDHGATWHPQLLTHQTASGGIVAPTYIQVASNGRVYLGMQTEAGGDTGGSNFLYRSDDGGVTWSSPFAVGSYTSASNAQASGLCVSPLGGFVGVVHYLAGPMEADSSLRIAVNPQDPDNVVVTNNATGTASGDDSDVFLWRSSDGGTTWSGPVRVNDDSTTTDQFMPDLWFAPDGTLGVMWLDRRNDPDDNWKLEVWMALSHDGGATFSSSFPVSSSAFSPAGRCQMSDYNGIYADNNRFYLAWGDSRAVDGMQQQNSAIRAATVPLAGPGALLRPQVLGPGNGAPAGQFKVTLQNDGLVAATGLQAQFVADNASGAGASQTAPVADIGPAHNTATASFVMPASISGTELHGTLTVTGDQGSASYPLIVPKVPGAAISVLSNDFESGLPAGWILDQGLIDNGGDKNIDDRWQVSSSCAATDAGHSGTQVAYFGDISSCTYGNQIYPPAPLPASDYVYGTLSTPSIHLPAGNPSLQFREWVGLPYRFVRQSSDYARNAQATLQISTDGGQSFERIWGYGEMSRHTLDVSIPLRDSGNDYSGEPTWHDVNIDLSPYAGKDVILRWFFEGYQWQEPGYAIDDIEIQGQQGLDLPAASGFDVIPALGIGAAAALALLLLGLAARALRARRDPVMRA
ncbi:MAG: sialidase family protein [Rhodanobacteraceae bacterium]